MKNSFCLLLLFFLGTTFFAQNLNVLPGGSTEFANDPENDNCAPYENLNIAVSGSVEGIQSVGVFDASGNTSFGLSSGLVISTGSVSQVNGSTIINEGSTAWAGSSLYENLVQAPS